MKRRTEKKRASRREREDRWTQRYFAGHHTRWMAEVFWRNGAPTAPSGGSAHE